MSSILQHRGDKRLDVVVDILQFQTAGLSGKECGFFFLAAGRREVQVTIGSCVPIILCSPLVCIDLVVE